jgi:hypothetical protein
MDAMRMAFISLKSLQNLWVGGNRIQMNQKLSQLPCNVKRRKNTCEFTIIGGYIVGQVTFSRRTHNTDLVISFTFGPYYLDKNASQVMDQDAGYWKLVTCYWILD